MGDGQRVVQASRVIDAPAAEIFEHIADPALQPAWDGNDNLSQADAGQRVRKVDEVFVMVTTKGLERHNHVVEFEEGRRIAWLPAEPGREPFGQLWRWELRPLDDRRTEVIHTYDWTDLRDEARLVRARATTADWLHASLDRLATLLTGSADGPKAQPIEE